MKKVSLGSSFTKTVQNEGMVLSGFSRKNSLQVKGLSVYLTNMLGAV